MCHVTTMRIRPAELRDASDVARHAAHLAAEFALHPVASGSGDFSPLDLFVVPKLVVEWSGSVLGSASWSGGGETARLVHLVIDPAFAGAGLGRRLLQAVEQAARQSGATELEFVVPVESLPFATATGFRPKGLLHVNGQSVEADRLAVRLSKPLQ